MLIIDENMKLNNLDEAIDEDNYSKEVQIIVSSVSADLHYQQDGRANYLGSLGTDEDDDDLLKEDPPSNWDIFDDYHKFERMDQKIKEKRK